MKSTNLILLNKKSFAGLETSDNSMTLNGTINKTLVLLSLVVISTVWTLNKCFEAPSSEVESLAYIGIAGGFGVGLFTILFKQLSCYTAPLYALLEGLAIGVTSSFFDFNSIIVNTVITTFAIFFCFLVSYKLRIITVTETFKANIITATSAVALLYLVDFMLMLFGYSIEFIHETDAHGILFTIVVIFIAASNLILDFELIETGIQNKCPKYMEWYTSFSLLVTIIWLYLEVLRLMGKSND